MENILNSINEPSDIKKLSISELKDLAVEIRRMIIKTVAKNGGHLASNLGIVEATLAIHKVFDLPKDSIIFDVGHQCYTHKIITERKDDFYTLRQQGGISGFPKREESTYDSFNTGHSSTSISAAVGMARANRLQGKNNHVVALIGDGALTGGMAWEAINDLGHNKEKVIIILNDNEMSINRNVGAMSRYLNTLRTKSGYVHAKLSVSRFMKSVPGIGKPIYDFFSRLKDSFRFLFMNNMLFEEMGLKYYGILDGHDIRLMTRILEQCKEINGPVLIHIKTRKGRGYKYASSLPDQYHSTTPFDIKTGEKKNKGKYNLPVQMSERLIKLGAKDSRICVITAAMQSGCGLDEFKKANPTRFFDVGIAEAHAVTMAAGLAAGGMKPVFSVYSTFLQRAYDQIVHDVCLQNLPVVFLVYNSGIVGSDGETHQGVYDISFLRHIPNLKIISPSSKQEAENALDFAFSADAPIALLLGNQLPEHNLYNSQQNNMYKWAMVTKAKYKKVALISNSSLLVQCMDAAIDKKHYSYTDVFNARSIKPLDKQMLGYIANNYEIIITVEDNLLQGGFGSAVLEHLNKYESAKNHIICLGYDDIYIEHGSKEFIYNKYSLDTEGISKLLDSLKLSNEDKNAG
ncbi:MAG: 1-deoxy-D-xylulose-5-phosphate synthase [Clostridia bacterium]|nr:1-deoxy-D-xylulose-5-phosphate synthase [Clostridia bacterium]